MSWPDVTVVDACVRSLLRLRHRCRSGVRLTRTALGELNDRQHTGGRTFDTVAIRRPAGIEVWFDQGPDSSTHTATFLPPSSPNGRWSSHFPSMFLKARPLI